MFLTDFGEGGVEAPVIRTRPVSALDVAHTLASELDLSTGLLPSDCLWWVSAAGGVRIAVWREPRVWTVRLRERFDAPPKRLRLPMPGLLFVCLPARQAPYVFAAPARPHAPEDPLFHAPCVNVFATGRVCVGSHAFPADPAKVPEAFFESFFSLAPDTARGKSRRQPEDVTRLWAELHRQPSFPMDDLVPQCTVADAMRLGQ